LADHEKPQRSEKDQGSQIHYPGGPILFWPFFEPDFYPVLLQSLQHCRLIWGRNDAKTAAFDVISANRTPGNRDRAHLTTSNPRQKIGIAYLGDGLARTAGPYRLPE